ADSAAAQRGRPGRCRDPGYIRLLQGHRRRTMGHHRRGGPDQRHTRNTSGDRGQQAGTQGRPGRVVLGLMIDTTTISGRPAWLEHETLFEKSVKVVVFAFILFFVIYPFFSVIATSLASDQDVIKNGGLVIWPEHPTWNSYRTIFAGGVVTRAAMVSIGITV